MVDAVDDDADGGLAEAAEYAQPIALSPPMRALLDEALAAWSRQFDGSDEQDLSVSGAELIEWFADWRVRVRAELCASRAV